MGTINLNAEEFYFNQCLAVLDDDGNDTGQRVYFAGSCVNNHAQCYVKMDKDGLKGKLRPMHVKNLRDAKPNPEGVKKLMAEYRARQEYTQTEMDLK